MNRVRMAQIGTGHGHAAGKMRSMRSSPEVEVAGICEPDEEERRRVSDDSVYEGLHWYDTAEEMLNDDSIAAVASEGRNSQSLDQTEQIVAAGKHVWYDKPAGDDYGQWERVLDRAREQGLQVQMGYMLRYNPIFAQVTEWARSGFLGDVFSVRAHMSTSVPPEARERIAEAHAGGVHYDLAGHMLDLVVWMLGRPARVTAFLRNDTGQVPAFSDNTLGVYEFDRAMAIVDIAAMETAPMARRFEVYGTRGSAIILEPFEPGHAVRLCLDEDRGGYRKGEQIVELEGCDRQTSYDRELAAFLATIAGDQEPDRPREHELLVQETLLRGIRG
ncbi:MAG: Gfo/Idh/MocA family oxidoreductase [Gemmatimonadaceae bacterium]|nr:Gfo/Idh/MocA family oxidoreductase [Gemmatimonadaceae bacterium]